MLAGTCQDTVDTPSRGERSPRNPSRFTPIPGLLQVGLGYVRNRSKRHHAVIIALNDNEPAVTDETIAHSWIKLWADQTGANLDLSIAKFRRRDGEERSTV